MKNKTKNLKEEKKLEKITFLYKHRYLCLILLFALIIFIIIYFYHSTNTFNPEEDICLNENYYQNDKRYCKLEHTIINFTDFYGTYYINGIDRGNLSRIIYFANEEKINICKEEVCKEIELPCIKEGKFNDWCLYSDEIRTPICLK